MDKDKKEKLYFRLGCLFPMGIVILFIFIDFPTSNEEIKKLINEKKNNWISNSISETYYGFENNNDQFISIIHIELKNLGKIKNYKNDICQIKSRVTVEIKGLFGENEKNVYTSLYDQQKDCENRFNYEVNKFIYSKLKFNHETVLENIDVNKTILEVYKEIYKDDPSLKSEIINDYKKTLREQRLLQIVLNKINTHLKNYD